MFWYFSQNEITEVYQADTIFCDPTFELFNVKATADLTGSRAMRECVQIPGEIDRANINITEPFNG